MTAVSGTRRPADADVERRAERPLEVGLLEAQRDHRDVRDRERDHRAEGVEVGQQAMLPGRISSAGDDAEEDDRHVRREPLGVHAAEDRRQLAVLAQRVGEARRRR